MKAIVRNNQSLFDIAIQHCGAADAAYAIAVLNNISITDELTVGQVLVLPEPINKDVVKYYKDKGINPATASPVVAVVSPLVAGDITGYDGSPIYPGTPMTLTANPSGGVADNYVIVWYYNAGGAFGAAEYGEGLTQEFAVYYNNAEIWYTLTDGTSEAVSEKIIVQVTIW